LTLLTAVRQTGAIDDAYRSVSACTEPEKHDEGKKIVEQLARLKYEIQHDRALTYVAPACSNICRSERART